MIEDAHDLRTGDRLEADIVVVGAGAAGIAIALRFAHTSTRVLVLEGGGRKFERAAQELYSGHNAGLRYEPLDLCRVKGLGGSTSRMGWAGWCKPLLPIDFEQRPWVPLSGWPVDRRELEPYYRAAFGTLSLPPDTDSQAVLDGQRNDCLPIGDSDCRNEPCALSPAPHLGEVWEPQLRSASNVRVLLHANVTEVQCNDDATHITGVRCATLTGVAFSAHAPIVVLAAGGIENARLLLLSDQVEASGLGNRHGFVGRCFMDHPRFAWGQIRNVDRPELLRRYDPTTSIKQSSSAAGSEPCAAMFGASLVVSPETQRREQILNARSWILPVAPSGERPGGRELREMVLWLKRKRVPADVRTRAGIIAADLPNAVAAVVAHLRSLKWQPTHWQFQTILEPEPNADSRVTLTADRDRLGLRRTQLDWRLGALTEKTLQRTQELLIGDLRRIGIDCSIIGSGGAVANQTVANPRWVWHHMGTTRMSADPRTGVVDANCRVHGIDNLFVAGSSVFPTVGNDMPTVTLIALAHRLAEHVKTRLCKQ